MLMTLFSRYGIASHVAMRMPMPHLGGQGFFGAGQLTRDRRRDIMPVGERTALLRLGASAFLALLLEPDVERKTAPLTRAEAEVMRALARGLTPAEIAEALGKSLSTVRHQIVSARGRLGGKTMIEAILRAERLGIP